MANIDTKRQNEEADELHDAILNGIESWENTREGDEYWDEIHLKAYKGEIEQNL